MAGRRPLHLPRLPGVRAAARRGARALRVVQGSRLGVVRRRDLAAASAAFGRMAPELRHLACEPHVLVLTKATARSTVHRAVPRLRRREAFDDDGTVVGERRFLGLFTRRRTARPPPTIPMLRRKVQRRARRAPARPADGHDGKDLEQILETYPRDELFQMSSRRAVRTSRSGIAAHAGAPQTRLFMRRDRYGRFVSCLVYLPRDRYTTPSASRWPTCSPSAFAARPSTTAPVSESVLARLHFVVRVAPGAHSRTSTPTRSRSGSPRPPRSWDDDFVDALVARLRRGGRRSACCAATPTRSRRGYKEDFPRRAVADLDGAPRPSTPGGRVRRRRPAGELLRAAADGPPASAASRSTAAAGRLAVRRAAVLQHMGVEVVDERPYEIAARRTAALLDLRLRPAPRARRGLDVDTLRGRFEDAFLARLDRRRPRTTASTRWCCGAALTWREVGGAARVRAYLRQAGSTFSQAYIERALSATPDRARCWSRCSRRASTRRVATARRGRPASVCAARSTRRSTRSRASTRTASCARSWR